MKVFVKRNGDLRSCSIHPRLIPNYTLSMYLAETGKTAWEESLRDGTRDATSILVQFFQHVRDKRPAKSVVDLGPGTFTLNRILNLTDPDRIVWRGFQTTLRWPTADGGLTDPDAIQGRQHIKQTKGRIIVHGLTVTGAAPEGAPNYQAQYAFQHAWATLGGDAILLGVKFTHPWGDFFYIGTFRERTGEYGNYVYIDHVPKQAVLYQSKLHRCGRQGVGIAAGNNIEICDNDFSRLVRSSVDIEPNVARFFIGPTLVQGNTFHNSGDNLFTSAGYPSVVHDLRFVHNEVTADNPDEVGHATEIHINGTIAPDGKLNKRRLEFGWNTGVSPQGTPGSAGGRLISCAGVLELWIHHNKSPYDIRRAPDPTMISNCTPFPGKPIEEANEFTGYYTDGPNKNWPPA